MSTHEIITKSLSCPHCGAYLECTKKGEFIISPTVCPSCDLDVSNIDWESFFDEQGTEVS